MFQKIGFSSKVVVCALALASLTLIVSPINAQERPNRVNRQDLRGKRVSVAKPDFARYLARPDGSMPMVSDWSNRHIIYTAGYSAAQADRIAKDPRAYASFLAHGLVRRHRNPIKSHLVSKRGKMKRDWAVSLGNGGPLGGAYPAKYTFDVNAPPSCANDFVVFPIALDTGSSRAHVPGTFTGDPDIGEKASITITPVGLNPVTLTLTAGTTNSGMTFAVSGTNNTITDAANLTAAINRNLSGVAVDEIAAVPSASTVGVYSLTAGTEVTLTAAGNLNNFSWGSVISGKNGSQANIVGLNHLYAGSGSPLCAGYTYPTFTFSYAAGVGQVYNSPVISLDGKRIAFIESDPSLGSILHVLTLGTGAEHGTCANSGSATPTCAIAAVIPGSTPGSNASDYMLPLDLTGGLSPRFDYYSSPFVDYSNDVLYVGDGSGYLFSVSPVFGSGTPALRNGFPVLLNNSRPTLASPVVDVDNTGNILIEDIFANLYNVTSDGIVEGYTALGYNETLNNDIGPVIDSTNGVGYITSQCNTTPFTGESAVFQFTINAIGSPDVLATALLSASDCASSLGVPELALDNNYYAKGISSTSPGSNGELLVIYINNLNGSLAQYQFTSGIMNTTAEYTDTNNGDFGRLFISPPTEFYGNDQTYSMGMVTQSGNTVTVTTSANAFASNQVVVISGVGGGTGGCTSAAVNAINGEQYITVTSPTTFTFTSAENATIDGSNGSCNLKSATATGPTQDYLFFASDNPEIFAFDLPLGSDTQAPEATNTTSISPADISGIIVDNDSDAGQASSIYFGASNDPSGPNCGTVGIVYDCAVKLTQSGLN